MNGYNSFQINTSYLKNQIVLVPTENTFTFGFKVKS